MHVILPPKESIPIRIVIRSGRHGNGSATSSEYGAMWRTLFMTLCLLHPIAGAKSLRRDPASSDPSPNTTG